MSDEPSRSARFGRVALLTSAGIAGLAAALQAVLFALERAGAGRRLWGDEVLYLTAARRVLGGGPSDLDPLWPPLYPHLLAALGASHLAAEISQTLLLVATALLLADLARRTYGAEGPAADLAGALAGGLLLLDPQVAAFSHYLWPEIVHLFLFVAAFWGMVRIGARFAAAGEGAGAPPIRPPWIGLALLGVAFGLALQAKSLLLPFVPILFIPLFVAIFRRFGPRRGALCALAAAAALAATLTPTLLANVREGIGFRLADSSKFNLWVGLNDTSRRNLVGEIVGHKYELYRNSAPTFPERNEILDRKLRRLVAREGVPKLALRQVTRQPFRLFDRESFFTDQLPGGAIVAEGRGYRDAAQGLSALLRAAGIAIYVAILLAAVVGIARGKKAWAPLAAPYRPVLLAFLAYNLLLFLALHAKTRYRIQMMPVIDLFAAFGVAGLWQGVRLSRRATIAAVAAALLVLGLVFGGRALDARWPQAPLAPLDPVESER
ncbi:MAG TPA: phospholipid carrier-dependent glycosyltransferase [Thermoanaerobaculia bacterium]|jgi:hypothetical protein|nr:phospholipid carrier-dependent glycosyltransferase [Thermoanaerobaculia bacterium]